MVYEMAEIFQMVNPQLPVIMTDVDETGRDEIFV